MRILTALKAKISSWLNLEKSKTEEYLSEDELRALTVKFTTEENGLEQTLPLNKKDFELIGTLIQTYCIADLHARRVLNSLRALITGENTDFAGKLNDGEVLEHLKKNALAWEGPIEVKDGLRMATETIEMHRELRHNFAHWVTRRINGTEVFVMLSKNLKEAKKRDGIAQGINEFKYGIAEIIAIKTELEKLKSHAVYFSKVAEYLDENFEELKDQSSGKGS